MAFWSKKEPTDGRKGVRARAATLQQAAAARENPYRALDPAAFDKGAKINRCAAELRRLATSGELVGSEVIVALQTALGGELAATILRNNSGKSPEEQLYVLDQMLDGMNPGIRQSAYMEANFPAPPEYEDGKDLTEDEFRALTTRIVNEATKNNVPVTESLTATVKVVGLIICILAERRGVSAEELVKFSQNAVAEFTREAQAYRATVKS